jgi:hypothetical protein
VLKCDLDKVPGSPWVEVRGKWLAKDQAVWGSQKPSDGPAAMRCPLSITDGDIQYEASLPAGTSHTLRVQCQDRDQVLLIQVSARRVAIMRQRIAGDAQGSSPMLAEQSLTMMPDRWVRIRASFRGPEIAVQVGDAIVRGSLPSAAQPKVALALMASGEKVGFAKLVVTQQP